MEGSILSLEGEIKKTSGESQDVKLFTSIPVIDYHLASLLSSYIGDIKRFGTSDRLASFFGNITSTKDLSTIKRRVPRQQDGPSHRLWIPS